MTKEIQDIVKSCKFFGKIWLLLLIWKAPQPSLGVYYSWRDQLFLSHHPKLHSAATVVWSNAFRVAGLARPAYQSDFTSDSTKFLIKLHNLCVGAMQGV